MTTRDDRITIPVDDQEIAGTLVTPATVVPGVLFLHGWGGSPFDFKDMIAALVSAGYEVITFDAPAHGFQ